MADLTGKYVANTYQKILQIDPNGTTSSNYVDFSSNGDYRLTNGLGNKIKGIIFERPSTPGIFSQSGIFIKRDDNSREMYFSMSGTNGYGEITFSGTGSSSTLYIIGERSDNSAVPGSVKIQSVGLGFYDLPIKEGDILIQSGQNSLDPQNGIILYSETENYFIGGSLVIPSRNRLPPEPPIGPTVSALVINNTTGQLYKVSSKSFVIKNPLDENKYLVHACIEGPESAVFYRGESKLINGEVEIELPKYFESLTHETNRTVQLTPITNENGKTDLLSSSKVIDGKFKVKSILEVNLEQEFYWEVKAERKDVERFEVEPNKSDYLLNGDGPYTYLSRK